MVPDAYYAGLEGEVGETAKALRAALLSGGLLEEHFKHGHPIYVANDIPVCLVKPAKKHVLFAFWEGGTLLEIDPRLSRTGGANMASMKLTSPAEVSDVPIVPLVKAAIELTHGQEGAA